MAEDLRNKKLETSSPKKGCLLALISIRKHLEENKCVNFEITSRFLISAIQKCVEVNEESYGGENLKLLFLVNDILRLYVNNLRLNNKSDNLFTEKYISIKAQTLQAIHSYIIKLRGNSKKYPNVKVTDVFSLDFLHYNLLLLQKHTKNMVGIVAYQIFCFLWEHYFNEPSVKHALAEALQNDNDLVRIRLYEMACGKLYFSPTYFKKLDFVFDHAMDELENGNNDLLKISILEVIYICAEHKHGFEYFEKRNVFDMLAKRIKETPRTLHTNNVILSIMTFFSEVAKIEPRRILYGYRHVVFGIFKWLYFGNNLTLPRAFEAFANLTTTPESVIILDDIFSEAILDIFVSYSYYLRFIPYGVKFSALESLERIFTFDKSDDPQLNKILQHWFIYLNDGTNTMVRLAKCFFHHRNQIRLSALYVIRAACFFPWGIEAMKNTTGFLNFLVKRVEHHKEVKYATYMVVEILNDSGAFDPKTSRLLRNYVERFKF